MAFIQKLPRTMSLKEKHYGTPLDLRIYADSRSCDGTYSTVPTTDVADEDNKSGPGHAILWGHIDEGRDDGEAVLRGEWRHVVRGVQEMGPFEIKIDSQTLSGDGWWSKEGEDTQHPWEWAPGTSEQMMSLLSKPDGRRVSLQALGSLGSFRSLGSFASLGSVGTRRSLSSKVSRASSFFDDVLQDESGKAVWIARYGIFCAWIFFFQTAAALAMTYFGASDFAAMIVSCAFQGVYSITYASFLTIYSRMTVKPPMDYVSGVVLYTLGYMCFMALYVVLLYGAMAEADGLDDHMSALYLAGSLFFLLGSIVLVKATIPPPVEMAFRELTFFGKLARFSLKDQHSSLFWGSTLFLLGSMLFTADSAWALIYPASKPENFSFWCCFFGYALFTPGRLYFLWGSVTADCDILFRGAPWAVRLPGGFRRSVFASKASVSPMSPQGSTASPHLEQKSKTPASPFGKYLDLDAILPGADMAPDLEKGKVVDQLAQDKDFSFSLEG